MFFNKHHEINNRSVEDLTGAKMHTNSSLRVFENKLYQFDRSNLHLRQKEMLKMASITRNPEIAKEMIKR